MNFGFTINLRNYQSMRFVSSSHRNLKKCILELIKEIKKEVKNPETLEKIRSWIIIEFGGEYDLF